MKTRTLVRALGLMVLLSGVAVGQETTPAPSQLGAYDLFGTLKVGYRVVSVNGEQDGDVYKTNARNLFREQYNMTDSGFALGRQLPLTLDLFGARREGQSGFFDQIFLNADFNPTTAGGSLRLRQFHAYDLNVSYKHVDYFFDRYDSLYTDLRRYESNRNDFNANLNVEATEFLGVNVGYRMISHGGSTQLPRPMFVEGAPEGVGTASTTNRIFFNAFRNYYLMDAPREDLNTELFGSLNAAFGPVDVTVGGGMTNYQEDYALSPVATRDSLPMNFRDTNNTAGGFANGFGIVGDGTPRERILQYSHTEDREMSGPYFFGEAVIKPADIFSLSADFRLDDLSGTTGVLLHQLLDVRKTTAAKAYQLYRANYAGEVDNELKRMRASVAATVKPLADLSVTAGWRMDRHELTSTADYHVAFDTTTNTTEIANFRSVFGSADSIKHMEWESKNTQPTQTFFGSVSYSPIQELTVSAGVKAMTRKPEVSRGEDGELDSVVTTNMSKEVSALGFDVGATYRPMRELRLRGRFEMMNREAKFGEDEFAAGPAAGTVTDLEPRTAPEKRVRFNASADWDITKEFSAGVRFGMQKASSDLNEGMFAIDGAEKIELVDDNLNFSGVLTYRLDDNTSFHVSGESRSATFSIPVTWTRGQELITPIYGVDPTAPPSGSGFGEYDSITVKLEQKTNDILVDLGLDTRILDALSIGAGVSFLNVTGEPTITAEAKSTTSAPVKGLGDITRTGGPFSKMVINGNVQYDVTQQFGVAADVMYAMQNDKELLETGPQAMSRFYGLNDYNGLSFAFSVVYNF